jgi:hypothetical protein
MHAMSICKWCCVVKSVKKKVVESVIREAPWFTKEMLTRVSGIAKTGVCGVVAKPKQCI